MSDSKSDFSDPSQQRQMALSKWDSEGGAGPCGSQHSGEVQPADPELTSVELVQLRIRVIALENLVIAFLAQASNRQLELVREMATYISPRPGFSQHPLTLHAASQMNNLVDRAGHFRDVKPS